MMTKYGFFPGCAYHSSAGYKESAEMVNRTLGIALKEINDWNCCGATVIFSLDAFKALVLAARIMALAEKQGFDEIVTGCNACYTTLRKASAMIANDDQTVTRINAAISKEGFKIERNMPVRHYLELLADLKWTDAWKQTLSGKLKGISVAAYYGCQFSRPWADVDHPERPVMLNNLIETMGFRAVKHSASALCCGASHAVPYPHDCRPLISRIIREAKTKGAQMITAMCPLCQFNLDNGQKDLAGEGMPVPYFSQLAGIALGIRPERLGISKLLVPVRGVLQRI